MKDFEEYETQNLKSLQKLYLELNQRVEHQEGINNLKSVFTLGLNYYLQNNPVNTDRDVSQNSNPVNTEKNELNRAILLDISPDYNKSGKHYRAELMRVCKLYMQNTKIIELELEKFNSLTKKFINTSKDNIEKIFELKKDPIQNLIEKVPYAGIVPKAVRYADSINLTRCILKDFKEISESYIQKEAHLVIIKYGNQFNEIMAYTKNQNLSENDKKYTENILKLVQDSKKARTDTYTKIFKNYTISGNAIRNICYNIQVKDTFGLALKTIKLLMMLG